MIAPTLSYSEGRHIPRCQEMLAGARIYYATISLAPPALGPLFRGDDEAADEPDDEAADEAADDLINDARILGILATA